MSNHTDNGWLKGFFPRGLYGRAALILFLPVVVVTLGGQGSGTTAACAWIYLAARILYVPAYVFGWVPWRSVIWAVGFAATMVMILAALF